MQLNSTATVLISSNEVTMLIFIAHLIWTYKFNMVFLLIGKIFHCSLLYGLQLEKRQLSAWKGLLMTLLSQVKSTYFRNKCLKLCASYRKRINYKKQFYYHAYNNWAWKFDMDRLGLIWHYTPVKQLSYLVESWPFLHCIVVHHSATFKIWVLFHLNSQSIIFPCLITFFELISRCSYNHRIP